MAVTERVVMVLVLVWGTQMQYGVAVTTKRLVVQEGQSVEFPCDLRYYTGRDFYWVRVRPDVTVILKRTADSPLDEFILRNQYRNRTDIRLKGPNGTTLQMVVRREDEATNGVYIECQQPQSLQEDKRKTRYELVVTLPPDPRAPTITGYNGEFLESGSSLTLTCVSTGGKPPSDLTWWRDGRQLTASHSHTTDSTGQGNATSILDIPALQPADNGGAYQCRASQLALSQVEISQVTLRMAFLEDTTITGYTAETAVDSGTTLTLTCTSGSSNPAATITWSRDGGSAFTGTNNREQAGNYGGMVTSQDLAISLQPQHNGAQYTCRATNSELSVHRESSVGPLNVRGK
ncbi:nephrin-like [Branchiostoma floridae]|uniref:Nephrin-like n=1 Tax=Branchiostoma floridae TaxID=7739 RepID=A0A9J7HGZ7_BRAFL|nr:nephrin-like [Branchiostoma floridae]